MTDIVIHSILLNGSLKVTGYIMTLLMFIVCVWGGEEIGFNLMPHNPILGSVLGLLIGAMIGLLGVHASNE